MFLSLSLSFPLPLFLLIFLYIQNEAMILYTNVYVLFTSSNTSVDLCWTNKCIIQTTNWRWRSFSSASKLLCMYRPYLCFKCNTKSRQGPALWAELHIAHAPSILLLLLHKSGHGWHLNDIYILYFWHNLRNDLR